MNRVNLWRSRYFLLSVLLFSLSYVCFGNVWSEVETPTSGPVRIIGGCARGCIAGAAILPDSGPGYRVMHLERNRYYGHPDLIGLIQNLGKSVEDENLGILHVGDLSQPVGGPTPFSHASHQNGLDADIWFLLAPEFVKNADKNRSNIGAPSFLIETGKDLNGALWNDSHRRVLEITAKNPKIERIFVNPHIKKDLCLAVRGDRSWLRKIRPWWGHDDHFHIRLSCPKGSSSCSAAKPVPKGEGCDASLDWWVRAVSSHGISAPKKPGKEKTGNNLPPACFSLLKETQKHEKQ